MTAWTGYATSTEYDNAYCLKTDLEKRFGTTNIATWADLDNDSDSIKIAARIEYALAETYNEINTRCKASVYAVPLVTATSTVPSFVRSLATDMSGLWLWTNRGIEDSEIDEASVYATIERKIQKRLGLLIKGSYYIDAVKASTVAVSVSSPYVAED